MGGQAWSVQSLASSLPVEAVKLEPHAVEGGGKEKKTKKVWSPLPPFSRMSLSINAGPAILSLPEAVSLVPGIQVRTFAADGTEIPPGECIDLQPFSTHATIKVFSARPLDSFRATTSAGFTLDAPRSDVLGDRGYISHWSSATRRRAWHSPTRSRPTIEHRGVHSPVRRAGGIAWRLMKRFFP